MPRRHRAGFSMVELGIVIAVVAVLAVVVIGGMGYVRAARERTAVDLVLTIHKAARQFAMRHHGGLRYGTSTRQNLPTNVTLKGLMGEGFLPNRVTTPWGSDQITVAPSDNGPLCAGFACLRIEMEVPPEECADGLLVAQLQDKAVARDQVGCNGNRFFVVMR